MLKTGDLPLTFDTLLYFLERYKINFTTLLFAQGLLNLAFDEGVENKDYNPAFLSYHGNPTDYYEKNIIDENQIRNNDLQNLINVDLKRLMDMNGINFRDAIDSLNLQNNHFLRARFLNSIFEVLNKYLIKYESQFKKDEGRKNYLRTQLQKKDWYIMLYILRNNASHADGIHTPFEAPWFLKDSKKNSFVWKTISVSTGVFAHSIRYNNDEILELFEEMFQFIMKHKDLFTMNNKGELLPALL